MKFLHYSITKLRILSYVYDTILKYRHAYIMYTERPHLEKGHVFKYIQQIVYLYSILYTL